MPLLHSNWDRVALPNSSDVLLRLQLDMGAQPLMAERKVAARMAWQSSEAHEQTVSAELKGISDLLVWSLAQIFSIEELMSYSEVDCARCAFRARQMAAPWEICASVEGRYAITGAGFWTACSIPLDEWSVSFGGVFCLHFWVESSVADSSYCCVFVFICATLRIKCSYLCSFQVAFLVEDV